MIKPIARDGGTRFQVYGRAGGKKVYVGTFDSKREAVAAVEDHRARQRAIAAGTLPPQIDLDRTCGAAVTAWLAALVAAGSRSADEYASRARLYILPVFAGVPLVEIRKSQVLAWRDELATRVAPVTVNSAIGALSAMITWCIGRDWLEHNVCRGVKRLKPDGKVYPWLQTPDAITRLLSALSPKIRTLVAVLIGTGLRLDEALHLRWDDVDLDHRLIHVHRGRKGTTKSGKVRRVPILDSVLAVLRGMKLSRGGNTYLWAGGDPRKRALHAPRALSQACARKPFKVAIVEADLPAHMRLHDCRHTFASLYLADGGNMYTLSKILGHSSVAITERCYAHLAPDAFERDYGRVRFAMPLESPAPVVQLHAVPKSA